MTVDYESVEAHIELKARELWSQAQEGLNQESAPPAEYGTAVRSVTDQEIADKAGVDLLDVRQYLDGVDGRLFVLGRDGDTRTVKAVVTYS